MSRIQTSTHLQTVPLDDGFAIFHSLFGNLSRVDVKTMRVLRALEQPVREETFIRNSVNPTAMRRLFDKLKTRSFLVPPELDEYEVIRKDMRVRELCLPSGYLVRSLQLIVSNRCNLGCTFCFFKSHTSDARAQLAKAATNLDMDFDTAKTSVEKVLKLAQRHRAEALGVEFFGGEPTLNWPVIKKVLDTFGRGGSDGLPQIVYSITTNGISLTQEMAKYFKEHSVTVTVSYNYPTDPNKPVVPKDEHYEKVRCALDILRRNDNFITINTVLLPSTIDRFDFRSFVDFAIDCNARELNLILDLNTNAFKDSDYTNQAMGTVMATYGYGKGRNFRVMSYWHEVFAQLTGHQSHLLESGKKYCPGTGCKLSIEPGGEIFVCKGCAETIGHISDLEGALSSDKYKEYAFRAYRNAPECKGCSIEGFCSGGCMGSVERHYHRLDAIDPPLCTFFKEVTERLIRQMHSSEFEGSDFTFPDASH